MRHLPLLGRQQVQCRSNLTAGVGQIALKRLHGLDLSGQLAAFTGDRLGGGRVVPKAGILDAGVKLVELS